MFFLSFVVYAVKTVAVVFFLNLAYWENCVRFAGPLFKYTF
jgi:hypothetical protein